MQSVVYSERQDLLGLKVKPANKQAASSYHRKKICLGIIVSERVCQLTWQCLKYLRCGNRENRCEPYGHSLGKTLQHPQFH